MPPYQAPRHLQSLKQSAGSQLGVPGGRASSSSTASNPAVRMGQCPSRTSKTHGILQKWSILITKSLGISVPYNSVSEKPSGHFSKDKLLACVGGTVGYASDSWFRLQSRSQDEIKDAPPWPLHSVRESA